MMEWFDVVVNGVCALIGALGGGGLLYYSQTKTAKKIANEASQSEEWRKLYEESKEDSKEKDAKIDKLYDKINGFRNTIDELHQRCTTLATENSSLKILKCEKAGCKLRQPPTGY